MVLSLDRGHLIGVSVLLIQRTQCLGGLFLRLPGLQAGEGVVLLVLKVSGVRLGNALREILCGIDACLVHLRGAARKTRPVVLLGVESRIAHGVSLGHLVVELSLHRLILQERRQRRIDSNLIQRKSPERSPLTAPRREFIIAFWFCWASFIC